MAELRTQEQQLLSALESLGGTATVEQLIQACGIQDTAVMRNALTLQEKNFLKIHAKIQNIIKLTPEGETYAKNGLPERNLILATADLGGTADLQVAAKKSNLSSEFVQIALGWTIRKKWATYSPQNNTLHITEALLHQTTIPEDCDEAFLKHLNTKHQAAQEDLSPELQKATEQLKKRKLVTIEPKTTRNLQITNEGKKAFSEVKIAPQEITQLTPEMIITGKWHTAKLQKYNIEAPVAKTWSGKKHPYLQFLDEVHAKLVQLGFQEMTGTAVETSFFNFEIGRAHV
jgi:phenylalanyl-tRNA synthetase alpha chain